MFHGSIVALITPFRDGVVDEKAFQDLVAWQIDQGTNGLVPCGTTGESATLSHDEHNRVIDLCVEVAAGRVPVIAGTGSNSTEEAIRLTRHAEKAGADGALVVAPYYNKPNQEGLYRHFKAIHDATALPIIVYNIPPRSVIDISVETMARLAALERVVGVKDATAKIDRVSLQRRACGHDFIQLSGEDSTALAFNAQGGVGVISVTANVAPRLSADLQAACRAGDFARALSLHDRMTPLNEALFLEPNPAGAKFALSALGRVRNELRLPMVPVSEPTEARIREAMALAGLNG